ncbi:proteinase-activated receptor 1 [Denticeps clupeoides]|uniref:Proteinase-activated receptor 1 n=1 Tax=Denticeps clupeoides TaxID=299321 RepID=A0AAY4ARG0_9TELE|nr:proteinase-activated receptor 1 [Denticeps clupeoides]
MDGRRGAAAVLAASAALLLHGCAALPGNGTKSILRTFSARFLAVTDEPIDYLDVLEGSSSGAPSVPRREHRHPEVKKHYYVTQEASEYLTGPMVTVFIPTVYTMVFLVSVPLNLLAVAMFSFRVRPKKPAVIYMLNLALADLLFVLLLPFRISYHFQGNNWPFGSGLCRVVTAAFYCNMYCSVLLMMCISVDRFMAVVYPMDSLAWRTTQTASVACGAMWFLSVGGVMPLLLSEQSIHLADLQITTCHDVLDVHKLRSYYLYFFPVFCALFFFIPFVFTSVCYLRIIQALCAANVENRAKKTRAIFMAGTVLTVFVACFTPTNVILLAHYVQFIHKHSEGSYAAYLLATCLGSVSCCLDPLIYYFGSSQCQRQVAALLRCRRAAKPERSSQSGSSTRTSRMETLRNSVSSQYRKLMA